MEMEQLLPAESASHQEEHGPTKLAYRNESLGRREEGMLYKRLRERGRGQRHEQRGDLPLLNSFHNACTSCESVCEVDLGSIDTSVINTCTIS